ncbi:MAG: ComEC/Rec2-related protein [Bacteroidetes bacterium]|nr:ComEC/Rec2-related protein [Bacteroidota bacterium]
MKIWNQAPLVRLIIPFIAGIIAAIYLPLNDGCFALIMAPYFIFIAAVTFIPSLKISYKRSWAFGLVINILLFALGYRITIGNTEKFAASHFSKFVNGKTIVLAKLLQSPLEKERSYKMVVEVSLLKNGEEWKEVSGKAMLYLEKDPRAAALKYGDEIIVQGIFNEIPGPQNPGEFDYKQFLSFHNVYEQCSADEHHWLPTGSNSGNIILRSSYALRDRLLDILKDDHIEGEEFAVGAALMLGYSDKLDAEILSAYSGTGALHVLSVSGLHVAIVYVVFNWLLFFLDKVKRGNIIKAVILILLLWFYSALTGLSPSVLRAATMFSFIIIAKAFNRYTNIYNTLAASAFVLLAFNPFLIMEVGFQLSYIAVIGIVYLQPKIYGLFEPENKLIEQAWTITAVSIAAQIATFPLGLYYFHQFPNYFLLSNFIVIPVSTVIIYLGIGLFAFTGVPVISAYLAAGFSKSVWLLNASVKMIGNWPYALQEGISITARETWLLYAMILFFIYYFTRPKVNYLFCALSVAVVLLCSQAIEQEREYGQHRMIVYNIAKTSAVDFIDAQSNVLLTDPSFAQNESALSFHIKQNWWKLGINRPVIVTGNFRSEHLFIQNNCIQFNEKKVVIVRGREEMDKKWKQPLKVDFLIVSKNLKMDIAELLKNYDPEQIIFDSSNSNYRLEKWKKECIAMSRNYYSVKDSGAFEADL